MNYVKRTDQGLIIDHTFTYQTGLLQYLNKLCMVDGSTFEGRLAYSKKIVGNYNNPIYINEDTLLVPTHSLREYKTVYFNLFTVEHVASNKGITYVIFENGMRLELEISTNKLENQFIRAKKLVYTIQQRKCLHTGIINRFYI